MKSTPRIIASAIAVLIFSITVAAAAGSETFSGGVTLAEIFAQARYGYAETETDCRETDSDCESWTDAPPYFVSGQCGDNLYWSLDTGEKVLRISGTGKMYDYSPIKEAPWYEHRRYIKSIEIESGATSIGSYAFEDCPRLQSISMPEGVESIGAYAFWDCTKLKSITIPDSVTAVGKRAFYGCSGMEKAEIGSGLKKIPDYMFYECTKLYDVTIAEGVEEIGDGAFSYCFSYYYYYYGHSTDITIPDSIKSIGNSAFSGCVELVKITLGNNVETIGDSAFYDCGVQNLTIPDSVKSIGYNAFNNSSLRNVSIGNGVTIIGSSAFEQCYNLQSVTIGNSVTSIGYRAFFYCDNLQSITIGNSVTTIGDSAFYGCYNLQSIVIPDSVTRIGNSAFYNCDDLKNIVLPNSIEYIENYAFAYCDSLRYVHIPISATQIDYNILKGTVAVICSNTENCYAKKYADVYGIEFFVCGEEHTPFSDVPEHYVCEFCQEEFWDYSSFENHAKNYHYCWYCGEWFLNYDSYNNHHCYGEPTTEPATEAETFPGIVLPDGLKPTTRPFTTYPATEATIPSTTLVPTEIVTIPEGITSIDDGTVSAVTAKIRKPSVDSVAYGDSIILHADVSALPNGWNIKWNANNSCFEMSVSETGRFCTVTPKENGSTVFSITVVDADGNTVCESEPVVLNAKAGLFNKILAFFKKLFGLTKILPEMIR